MDNIDIYIEDNFTGILLVRSLTAKGKSFLEEHYGDGAVGVNIYEDYLSHFVFMMDFAGLTYGVKEVA
jgi:hypothetical protein